MTLPREAKLLRIFFGENDARAWPLYEAIVLKAREAGLAGATVLRGPMGFGRSSRLHSHQDPAPFGGLPLIIEIVDTEDEDQGVPAVLDAMMGSGLVTLEKVQVLQYGPDVKHAPA